MTTLVTHPEVTVYVVTKLNKTHSEYSAVHLSTVWCYIISPPLAEFVPSIDGYHQA